MWCVISICLVSAGLIGIPQAFALQVTFACREYRVIVSFPFLFDFPSLFFSFSSFLLLLLTFIELYMNQDKA